MLTPEDLALARSLLKTGRVAPEALQQQISLVAGAPGKRLGESLEEAGLLPRGEAARLRDSVAAQGTRVPAVAAGAGGRRQLGRYQLVSELGRGGMGVVYEGFEPALKRRVAIKTTIAGEGAPEEVVERFLREARAVAALQHPNIVQVFDVGETDGVKYFAMEYVDGVSLDKVIKKEGALPVRRALRIAAEAAKALQHAHEKGIVHRDVKPGNILLAEVPDASLVRSMDGGEKAERVLLTDFGLAKEMGSGSSLTMSGNLIGTPAYMSPEQAAGKVREIDARSDVYSLGAVLYEMLSGKVPFGGETLASVLSDIQSLDAAPLRAVRPGVHRDLDLIVQKAMAKEKERRYATAGAFAEDIERWLSGEAVTAAPPTIAYRVARFARRHRAALVSAAACLLVVAGVGGWLGWRHVRDRRDADRRAADERRGREQRARARVAEARDAMQRTDFDAALVAIRLAEAEIPGFPDATEAARDCRRGRAVHGMTEAIARENWKGALAIAESAAEFRSDPEVARLTRRATGTCTLSIASAEPGLEADIGVPEPGVPWEESFFPPLEAARQAGLVRPLGALPVAAFDLPFGDHLVVISRGGRAVRVLAFRLARSSDVAAEIRVRRVGGPGATHETLAAALVDAPPGTVVELDGGSHVLAGVRIPPGVLVRAAAGTEPRIMPAENASAIDVSASHGTVLDGLVFEPAPGAGLLFSDALRPVVRRCRFDRFGSRTLDFLGADDWLVRDTVILQPRKTGIFADKSRGGTAFRVTCLGAGEAGFEICGKGQRAVQSVVEDSALLGIGVQGSDGMVVACRIFRSGSQGLVAADGSGIVLEDNLLVGNSFRPTGDEPASALVISCSRARFRFNTVVGGKGTAVAIKQSGGRFESWIAAGSESRAFHFHGLPSGGLRPEDATTFDWFVTWNCALWGRFDTVEFPRAADAVANPMVDGSRGGWTAVRSVSDGDPRFVAPESGDYRLGPSSPVRGKGRDGADPGVRWDDLAADGKDGEAWLRRENGRTLAREGLRALAANDPARARRLATQAALLAPGDPSVTALEERLK